MRVDSNTQGHRQWFYFSMKNEKPCTVKLHIYRFKKIYSLFQRGMRPYVRSRRSGQDWQPGGKKIKYHQQKLPICYSNTKTSRSFVLTFQYTFQHPNDEVFIASGIPYSYTYLDKQLTLYKTLADARPHLVFERSILTKSMCGLDLPLLSASHRMADLVHSQAPRKYIIINARTHSGENSSSWVLDGLLKELVSSQEIHEWMLTQNIEFRIIPMLNPDGVLIGNYRTGIIGDDFNRQFNVNKPEFYPEISALKRMVGKCKKEGEVELFLDLHGHSVLKNSFIYGPSESDSSKFKMKSLAYHLFHNSKYFRLGSCKFNSQKNCMQTARAFFQFQEQILSLTCENSLGLYYTQNQTFQMLTSDWQSFGQAILHSMKETSTGRETPMKTEAKKSVNVSQQVQKKIYQKEPQKYSVPKTTKNEKVYLKLSDKPEQNYLSKSSKGTIPSSLISRADEHLDLAITKTNEKIVEPVEKSREINDIKWGPKNTSESKGRKLSEAFQIPTTTHKVIHKEQLISRQNSDKQRKHLVLNALERSSTCDNATMILRGTNFDENDDDEKSQYSKYDLQAVRENFSEEYESINDLDSNSEDLPEQEKNYILQYIRYNQKQSETVLPEARTAKTNSKDSREPRISRFRQIRFKSIEQIHEDSQPAVPWKIPIKKLKLQPHKFKNNTTKSLLNKYNESLASEFEDPNMVAISQQKRLNERAGGYRRTQKDPFVLMHRKEKKEKNKAENRIDQLSNIL